MNLAVYRSMLDVIDALGVDPQELRFRELSQTVTLRTCQDFDALADAFQITNLGDRLHTRSPMRARDGMIGQLVIEHHCFPHLPCWHE